MIDVRRESARAFLAVLAIAAIATLPFSAEAAPSRAVVTEAGADPTGRADSTSAIQKCIDRVSAAGGGTVVVPPGEYRILYLTLRPRDLEWKMWPRALATAEILWTNPDPTKRDFAEFAARAAEHRRRLVREHVNCAPLK